MKKLIGIIALLSQCLFAQTIDPSTIVDWSQAGLLEEPTVAADNTLNILDYTGTADERISNAMTRAAILNQGQVVETVGDLARRKEDYSATVPRTMLEMEHLRREAPDLARHAVEKKLYSTC